ncbi:MAG: DUF6070 family protein [Lachnospiraceae bacterium]
MLLKKTVRFWMRGFRVISVIIISSCFLCACEKQDLTSDQRMSEGQRISTGETEEQREKGYDLPVDSKERQEAVTDCKKVMGLILELYARADKGDATNVVLNEKTIHEMKEKIKESGYSVITMEAYANVENQESVEYFLKECMGKKSGSVVVYELHSDGGIKRKKFIFDGKEMYLLEANATWDAENKFVLSHISYTRINAWKYTEKGWLCYELCVPQPPEVTEIVDGSCLLRIKPLTKEQREMSEKCVQGLGYKGNNLLCTDWDTDHMEKLDYNGMYEYLYAMKYQKAFHLENHSNGIPKDEFERLIMEYLPVTVEQIREYAVFDEEKQIYLWERLGCSNYAPTHFGTSLPEVTNIQENEDGTVTLTVDAVCDSLMCEDAVITHELTVRFAADGSFQYLGNKILNDGIMRIPDYQYRIHDKKAFENVLERTVK